MAERVEFSGTNGGTVSGPSSGTPSDRIIEAYTMRAIEDMMDQAHYSAVRYWADVSVNHGADERPYLISIREVVDDWVVPIEYGKKEAFTPPQLFRAMHMITHPTFKVRNEYKKDFAAILMGIEVDWDDEHADILMQAAMFGEVVYG